MRYKLEISLTARVINGLGFRRNRFAEITAQPVFKEVETRFASRQSTMSGMSFGKRI